MRFYQIISKRKLSLSVWGDWRCLHFQKLRNFLLHQKLFSDVFPAKKLSKFWMKIARRLACRWWNVNRKFLLPPTSSIHQPLSSLNEFHHQIFKKIFQVLSPCILRNQFFTHLTDPYAIWLGWFYALQFFKVRTFLITQSA